MKLVIFGLTVSSSWGNGHATPWRGLIKALGRRGHRVVFFERDAPYYASHRDLQVLEGGQLRLYRDGAEVRPVAEMELRDADVAIVTSYCPDGVAASELMLSSPARLRVFYDMDTPVTLERLERGETVPYLPPGGLGDFDLVLSFAGGRALTELQTRLGARRAVPLYGCVDPEVHRPVPPALQYRADLSYLGTYSPDRQEMLDRLFLAPARRLPGRRFVLGGSLYPEGFPWTPNIAYLHHVPPAEHPVFYCSSRLTLNVTRGPMARMGYCPSGRVFEAAACGVPILSDAWEGIEAFFEPGVEILVAQTTEEAVAALERSDEELAVIAQAAYERALAQHTAARRAEELEAALQAAYDHRGPEVSPAAQAAGHRA